MVEKVIVWKAHGILFDTEEEAVEHENSLVVQDDVFKIVDSFFYVDIDADDITMAIIENKDKLLQVLSK